MIGLGEMRSRKVTTNLAPVFRTSFAKFVRLRGFAEHAIFLHVFFKSLELYSSQVWNQDGQMDDESQEVKQE
jgi:hypothetical protein